MIERRRDEGTLWWTCDGTTLTVYADDGETITEQRPATAAELAAWFPDPATVEAHNAAMLADEAARAAAIASLTDPLTPRTVTGTTVATVKASADAAIKDIAAQTEARLTAIAEVLGSGV